MCKYCKKKLLSTREFDTSNLLILAFSVSYIDTLLTPIIHFQGSDYNIMAVAYTDGGHYIGRVKICCSPGKRAKILAS